MQGPISELMQTILSPIKNPAVCAMVSPRKKNEFCIQLHKKKIMRLCLPEISEAWRRASSGSSAGRPVRHW